MRVSLLSGADISGRSAQRSGQAIAALSEMALR